LQTLPRCRCAYGAGCSRQTDEIEGEVINEIETGRPAGLPVKPVLMRSEEETTMKIYNAFGTPIRSKGDIFQAIAMRIFTFIMDAGIMFVIAGLIHNDSGVITAGLTAIAMALVFKFAWR
jgi:hypothetical protein